MRATSGLIKVTVLPKSEEPAAAEEPVTEEPPEIPAEPADTAEETVPAEVLEQEKGIAVVPAAIGIGIFAVAGVVVILFRKRR
jgi:lipid-binding SYLF domain-containing protein